MNCASQQTLKNPAKQGLSFTEPLPRAMYVPCVTHINSPPGNSLQSRVSQLRRMKTEAQSWVKGHPGGLWQIWDVEPVPYVTSPGGH